MVNIKSGKTTDSLLNKLLQDKLRSRLKEAVSNLNQQNFSSPPFAALVDITTKCNLGCPWCIDKYAISNEEIPTKRMIKLLDEFKVLDIKSIVYFGGGEPLIHDGAKLIFEKTQNLDIDYAINTNGILLHKVISIISDSCSWVRVSWDAGNSEVYETMHHGKNFFDQIVKNTKKLARCAKGTVGVSFIVMESNITDISKATKIARDIGCDFIQFKPQYTPLKSNKRIIDYYANNLSAVITDELLKAKESEDDYFAVLTTNSLNATINEQPLDQNRSYSYCAAQQFVSLINPNGVYVCPNWRGAQEKSVGNIMTDSLADIWKSDRRKEVINQLDPLKECNLNCLRHNVNVFINGLLTAKKMGLDLLDYVKEKQGEEISDRYFL